MWKISAKLGVIHKYRRYKIIGGIHIYGRRTQHERYPLK